METTERDAYWALVKHQSELAEWKVQVLGRALFIAGAGLCVGFVLGAFVQPLGYLVAALTVLIAAPLSLTSATVPGPLPEVKRLLGRGHLRG